MSVEDKHYSGRSNAIYVTPSQMATHRQRLYDAKLALSSERDVHRAMVLLNQALDDTNDWEEK